MPATKATVSVLLVAATAVEAVTMYKSTIAQNIHVPSRLTAGTGLTLTHVYDDLPARGEAAKIPWVGSYWPKYRDSVNDQWDKSAPAAERKSPVAKYAAAFGVDEARLEDAVSQKLGIAGAVHRWPKPAPCEEWWHCRSGLRCAKRRGESTGICIESWEGICHAWAGAATVEEEPRRAVTRNGVTFKVNDLKALATLMYTVGRKKNYMSVPCKKPGHTIQFDKWGRPVANDVECADTNAGSFHVVAANFLGVHKRAFVEDRTWDEQIWNQPVRSFEVTETERVTEAREAMRLVAERGPGSAPLVADDDLPNEYLFNKDAVSWVRIAMTLRYITESAQTQDGYLGDDIDRYTVDEDYRYLLELDADGKIIGGEWLRGSKTNHPDFLTLSYGRTNQGMVGLMSWANVKSLLDESTSTA